MHDPRLPHCKPPPQSFDPPLLPDNEPPRRPYDTGPMPWPQRQHQRQHQGSLTGGAHKYDSQPRLWAPDLSEHVAARQLEQQKLKPLYTEKLPTSPAFKTKAALAQRRRDFWMKIVAYGGIALMVAAPVILVWKGTGLIPAGAFVAGLIIFCGVCIASSHCRRS